MVAVPLRVVPSPTGLPIELYVEPAVLGDDAQGCQCPFVLCLHPQGYLKEVTGHRDLINSGPGNRGLSACGTTHEATSRIPS